MKWGYYHQALLYQLAIDTALENGKVPSPIIMNTAMEAKERLKMLHMQPVDIAEFELARRQGMSQKELTYSM